MITVRVNKLVVVALLMVLAVGIGAGDALACPTCKDGMSGNDPISVARASGYFYSILFMMSMPFVIVGTFGGAAYFSIRRARQQQVEADSSVGNSQPLA
jgi:predicted cation transporter